MKNTFVTFLVVGSLIGCNGRVPKDVRAVLEKTSNREAFYASIEHYTTDTLKTQALFFLIRNLEGKGTVRYVQSNGKAQIADHDWSQYNSFDNASVAAKRLNIKVEKIHSFADADSLTSSEIINNIDRAFDAWHQPWAQAVSFRDFCEFILPYKDRLEPVTSGWRDSVQTKFAWVAMAPGRDNLSLAQRVNDTLRAHFSFNYNYVLAPPYPTLSRMHELGKGPCPYMTSLAIYTFRGLGIPTARDFVPYWTNIHHFSNHEWNAMLATDGKWYGFMGCEANPGIYAPKFQAAKVFRETYSNHPHKLETSSGDLRFLPDHLRRTDVLDVTDQYYATGDMTIQLSDSLSNKEILYVAVYNRKQWRVVYWGKVEGHEVTFQNMAKGVMYLPMTMGETGGFRPCMNPVIFDSLGKVMPVIPAANQYQPIVVSSFGLGDLGSKDYVNPLVAGQRYTLFYWDSNTWQAHSTKSGSGPTLQFDNVPVGALLSLGRDTERRSGEQLFFIDPETGKQVFW